MNTLSKPAHALRRICLFLSLLLSPSSYAVPGDIDSLDLNIAGNFVLATAVQPDGKTIIAGLFNSVLGVSRNHIARLNADGTLDASFSPDVNHLVRCVVVQDNGDILVGGEFTKVGTTTRNGIARLSANGTLDAGFNPDVNTVAGVNTAVYSVGIQKDGMILISGNFTSISGTERNRIARLTAGGALDTGFNPNANASVHSLVVQENGQILLGGSFTTIGGAGRNYIARVDANGSLDAGFNPNADYLVDSIAVQADAKILLGGQFITVSGTERRRIARLMANGTLDSGFNPTANGTVRTVVVQANGMILLGGQFTSMGGIARNRIARVAADGTLDAGFNPNANADVNNLAVEADGHILIAGSFSTMSGVGRNTIARLLNDPATQMLSAVNSSQVLWTRGGSAPEVSLVTIELSTNGGTSYTPLSGIATRVSNTSNWELTGLSLPVSVQLRARGRTAGGELSGSSGLVEQVVSLNRDTDSDGLLDYWEQLYWPSVANHGPLDDNDQDGILNLLEIAFGLNPTRANGEALPPVEAEGDFMTLTLTKQPGVTYEVQSASTLQPALPDSFNAATTTVLINNSTTLKVRDNFLISASPGRFIRVKVTAAP